VAIRIDLQTPLELDQALTREWLVTNGLGGFASGTITGINTRRYHGLLVSALDPPVRRMLLLAGLEEWLLMPGAEPSPLSAQEYWDGTVFPDGFRQLREVEIDGMLPCFRWSLGGRTIEKRIWMERDANRTVISYRLVDGDPATLRIRPLLAHRDYHEQRHGPGGFDLAETSEGWIVDAAGVRSCFEMRPAPTVRSGPDWYWRVLHRAERERGLDDEEDLFTPGVAEVELEAGSEAVVIAGTEPAPAGWDAPSSLEAAQRRQSVSLGPASIGPLAGQLSTAAEQFRVARSATPSPTLPTRGREMSSRSVIAGYHWFTDWGRDSMISLPGLALRPGSLWEARAVLETNLGYLDQGLIPNRFPDRGEAPEYNTMDATLWMFQAIAAYLRASGDWHFVQERLDRLEEIIDWHRRGTHHNIHVDEADGLLAGGEEGYALTWMDARVQDWVVTPRRGKPIEINALWYNALRLTADWCERAGKPAGRYREMATQAHESAQRRYWFQDGGYFYDCIDGPEGDDASLRPNQVMALALLYPLLEGERARAAFAVVTAKLLTPYGLRTLTPDDPRYRAAYRGDQHARDAAYHMGMVWPWLLGPYIDAHRRVTGNRAGESALLEPFLGHLQEAGLGTISEIFEPEPPFRPVGCIAQAWSVAEVLRHALTQA
jgi:predicted glycogen debranching enzyme